MSEKSTKEESIEETTPKEATEVKGTTSELFSEEEIAKYMGNDQLEKEVVTEKTEEKEPEITNEPMEEQTTKYLEDLGISVKTKINGEEGEVTVEELKKGYQTSRSLTLKGQELARREKELLFREESAKTKPSVNDNTNDGLYEEDVDGKLQRELAELRQTVASYAPLMGEVKYKSDLDELSAKMRSEGLDDFDAYIPKIEQEIRDAPQEEREFMMTYDHFENRFKSMKLVEMKSGKTTKVDERVKPKVDVESTSVGTEIETESITRDKLKSKAMETKDPKDWTNYFDQLNKEGRLIQRTS